MTVLMTRRMNPIRLVGLCAGLALVASMPAPDGHADEIKATLHQLELAFDSTTGGILRMSYPGVGTMLDVPAERCGLVAVALALEKGSAVHLGTRHSPAARLAKTAEGIVIHWDALGAAQPLPAGVGKVSATVTLKPAPDGRSIEMSCRIENQSGKEIVQTAFPDLPGLLPFGGVEQTEFRSGGNVVKPFVSLAPSDPDKLAGNTAIAQYTSGGLYSPMILRWMDFGSLKGGWSLFARDWGLKPPLRVLLHLWQPDKKLRLMVAHDVSLLSTKTWESGPFWLTPHPAGWAKGMEPYRAWVKENMKRVVPMPEHVRRGLGFRTLWLSRNYPDDPKDANFTFRDLVKVAQEAKEHGLDEMVLWGVHEYFLLPLPPFHAHLGGDAEFVKAVAECRRLGVNVAPFISVCNAKQKTAARYGLAQVHTGWTYHPEFIPRFNPPYAGAYRCAQISTHHPVWQQEVLQSCKRLIDMGVPSLSWDQYFIEPPEPNVLTLTREIRAHSRRRDPQSTFSAEELYSVEVSSDYLDFTWNWGMLRDCQPVTSAFPGPRVNLNVDASPAEVKSAFALNRYLNVQPRKADGTNGSDWIANHPELGRALRQCARLRAQFLPYFVEGTLLGDCLLSEPCPGTVVGSYVLGDRALLIVVNTGERRPVTLRCDPRPWLAPRAGAYAVRQYDGQGKSLASLVLSAPEGSLTTRALDPLDVELFEIAAQ